MTNGTMTGIDYFAWLVLIVIVVSVVVVFIALARLPGQIDHERGHPQAEAINAAGWLGLLLTIGVVWALAMIWALMKPVIPLNRSNTTTDEAEALNARAEIDTNIDAAKEVNQ